MREEYSFNPSGSMDYFGRTPSWLPMPFYFRVSILLGQWITLEGRAGVDDSTSKPGFNPSGSMDYFGSTKETAWVSANDVFQSFWVNGLLWKRRRATGFFRVSSVSILLGQWITLEVHSMPTARAMQKFQSFWVNGLLWKYIVLAEPIQHENPFQSFWVNGLLWKLKATTGNA